MRNDLLVTHNKVIVVTACTLQMVAKLRIVESKSDALLKVWHASIQYTLPHHTDI